MHATRILGTNRFPTNRLQTTPPHATSPYGASKWQFRWLCLLFISFSYELPVMELSPLDRANPRLFDVVAILGIIFIHPKRHHSRTMPIIYRNWCALVKWFVACSVIWVTLWLPWGDAGRFSLYYAVKYLEGLLVIYIVATMYLSSSQKTWLHYMVVVGGIFVALYAIPEYAAGGSVRELSGAKTVSLASGTILSSLGPTYFHVAMFSTVAFAMTLSLVEYPRRKSAKLPILVLAAFVSWPALACGARMGLVAITLALAAALIFIRTLRAGSLGFVLLFALAICTGAISLPTVSTLMGTSKSLERLIDREQRRSGNIRERIVSPVKQMFFTDYYQWQGWRLPVLGGGFYSVPRLRDGQLYFRRGYGIHNCYLFPLEQAGVVGLLLSGMFVVATVQGVRTQSTSRKTEDRAFAKGVWCFLLPLLLVASVGQVFWVGSGTENFNTFLLLLFLLATVSTAQLTEETHATTTRPERTGTHM